MRKQWLKREDIYYKPFYKQKSKMYLLAILLLGIIFIIYQAFSVNQLTNTSPAWSFQSTMLHLKRRHQQVMRSLGVKDVDKADNEIMNNKQNTVEDNYAAIKIIRGTRLFDYDAYKPNYQGNFKCLDGSAEIPFERLNDDYCDCVADGSDEPSTNACSVGRFYCSYQKRHVTGRGQDVFVPSSRINDGICDCCDGSDEWSHRELCQNHCLN